MTGTDGAAAVGSVKVSVIEGRPVVSVFAEKLLAPAPAPLEPAPPPLPELLPAPPPPPNRPPPPPPPPSGANAQPALLSAAPPSPIDPGSHRWCRNHCRRRRRLWRYQAGTGSARAVGPAPATRPALPPLPPCCHYRHRHLRPRRASAGRARYRPRALPYDIGGAATAGTTVFAFAAPVETGFQVVTVTTDLDEEDLAGGNREIGFDKGAEAAQPGPVAAVAPPADRDRVDARDTGRDDKRLLGPGREEGLRFSRSSARRPQRGSDERRHRRHPQTNPHLDEASQEARIVGQPAAGGNSVEVRPAVRGRSR